MLAQAAIGYRQPAFARARMRLVRRGLVDVSVKIIVRRQALGPHRSRGTPAILWMPAAPMVPTPTAETASTRHAFICHKPIAPSFP
jgi:hypothetical protein